MKCAIVKVKMHASRFCMQCIYNISVLVLMLLLSGCFGVGMRFAKQEKLRDPEGYERERRESRKWQEEDAKKHGYELPPYKPYEL